MELKDTLEPQLSEKLLALKAYWQRALDAHGDDSSDEDESELATRSQYTSFANIDIKKGTPNAFSTIVHKVGLCAYGSKEVNAQYYKLKSSLLAGNALILTEADIELWVRKAVNELIKDMYISFCSEGFHKRFAKDLIRRFLSSPQYAENLQKLYIIFKENPRLLLKIGSSGSHARVDSSGKLIDCLKNLREAILKFIAETKINYSDELFEVSAEKMALEVSPAKKQELRTKIISYLAEKGFIDKDQKFVDSRTRAKIMARERESLKTLKGPNFLLAQVLDIIQNEVKSSTRDLKKLLDDYMEKLVVAYLRCTLSKMESEGALSVIKMEFITTNGKESIEYTYGINREHVKFHTSFIGQKEQSYKKMVKLNYNHRWRLDKYFNHFRENVQKTKRHTIQKLSINRTILEQDTRTAVESPLSPLIFARAFNRSQTRSIRQKSEGALELGRKMEEESVFRSVKFSSIDRMALETQLITCNGNRSDKVENAANYSNIYTKLAQLMKDFKISDQEIAVSIRQIIKNEPCTLLARFTTAAKTEINQFLASLSHLLFMCEPSRHPACWVTHQMLLDLVSEGHVSWQLVLTETEVAAGQKRPALMPMVIEEAVKGARYLAQSRDKIMPRPYNYQGDTDAAKGKAIETAENLLVSIWLEKIIKEDPTKISLERMTQLMNERVEKWYGIKLEIPKPRDSDVLITIAKKRTRRE